MPNSFSDSFVSHTDSTSSITIHSTGNTELINLNDWDVTNTNLNDVFTELFLDTSARYPDYSDYLEPLRYSDYNIYNNYREQIRPSSQDYLEQIRPIISQEPTVEFAFTNSTDDKIKALEDRIEKLEEMIGILLDRRG